MSDPLAETCPWCGAAVPDDTVVCPKCGESLDATLLSPSHWAPVGVGEPDARDGARATRSCYARFLTSPDLREPYELQEGAVARIGRSRSCEICFPSNHVSRVHAEVIGGPEGWSIADLGSRNGTQVNGERIERRALRNGDRIVIGHFELVYRELSKDETLELLRTPTDGLGEDTAPIVLSEDAIFGDLARVSPVEVVQLIAAGLKTGCLTVAAEEGLGRASSLYFREGSIAHAEHAGHKGDEAASRILRLRDGTFSFKEADCPDGATVQTPTATLLLNALE